MLHRYTTLALLLLPALAAAQTVLFQEDFESPTPAFTLNTTDVNSVASGDNTWIVNNVYQGGSGSITCIGFPLPFTVPNTAAQPGAITPTNGRYLHVSSTAALNSGIGCASFVAADGLCAQPANHFARMSSDISTLGQSGVSLSFWWLCGGGTNNYGELYYSTNGGSSWTQLFDAPAQYRNQQSWTQQTITNAAFDGQATLRFGFRFFNSTTLSAQDPGFGVDQVVVTSAGAPAATVATESITPNAYCAGSAITVPYFVTGTFGPGNVFTAQLSDASGSFAAPLAVGSVAGTGTGSIMGVIPPGTPAGAGYRVRVVASAPATVGTDNGGDLTIGQPASAGTGGAVSFCANTGTYDLFALLGGNPDACGGWTAPTGMPFNGQFDSATGMAGAYTYTTNCPGPCPPATATLLVELAPAANAGNDVTTTTCASTPPASLFDLLDGGQLTGSFTYLGQPASPALLTSPGSYVLQYQVNGVPPCASDVATVVVNVAAAPSAGSSASTTVCANAAPFALLPLLGSADAGGTWTAPGGGVHSGTLNPATDASGLYTYYIQGTAPCPDAQSSVAVVVDPCTSIAERSAAMPLRWLGQQPDGSHLVATGGRAAREWAVHDATGRLLHHAQAQVEGERLRITLPGEHSGMYLLRVRTDAGVQVLRLLHAAR